MDCVFCSIAAGEIPSKKVYEDDYVVAFHDIAPQAKVHIIVIPKKHIASSADDINESNSMYIAKVFEAVPKIARLMGLKNGYRVINNCGSDACQTCMHIHFHILGGQKLADKMS